MTVYDARTLVQNSQNLSFFERLREIWICGKINEAIEKAAKQGKICIRIKFSSEFGKRMYKQIIEYYEAQGFDTHIYGYYRDASCPIYVGIGWKNI